MIERQLMMARILLVALLATACFAAPAAHADAITGVTVSTAISHCCGLPVENIVNGSGLSSYDPSATHAGAGGNWLGTSKTGTLDFDLHGSYFLDGIAVFNTPFGVKLYDLAISTDGSTFIGVPGFPVSLANPPSASITTAEIQNFALTRATHVRMTLLDGHSANNATGLKEVMFLGSTVPEPSQLSLVAVVLAALGYLVRKQA